MKKLTFILIAILCVTFVSHILFYYLGTAANLAEGTKFYDYDSFIAYMELDTDTSESFTGSDYPMPLKTTSGKILCEFVFRNSSVGAIAPANNEDGLPITVYSTEEFEAALQLRKTVNWIFIALYPVELLAAILTARKARQEHTA